MFQILDTSTRRKSKMHVQFVTKFVLVRTAWKIHLKTVKDFLGDKHEVEVILCFHYLICMLLPVLKQINKDQNDELEIEARIRGQKPSDLHIKQANTECSKQHCWYVSWLIAMLSFDSS
ncbi:lysine-specific demethylase JMJ28-like [Humulus lupulus]|uniref:lysine-specific demethylase JMJ28-like n=1 Tax=Humulus lupulus TaxID=3486 RepID=UPI002B41777A|nr:lysine-specific demethylase JMJ28-like [Humulus lupulus]